MLTTTEIEANSVSSSNLERLTEALKNYWGYDSFRPLQTEAMECALQQRDSVVVLPTGAGKSLCFQAPAVCQDGLTVVVSPLISLMKDQVDGLRACGVPAMFLNSTLGHRQQLEVADQIRGGNLRLLYVAPERLLNGKMLEFLKSVKLSMFAIDEAHCISSWGHDFRPEYRGLRALKETFPDIGVHAYTATASQRVREDIAQQLLLKNPKMLVGSFDRPNLIYRLRPRSNVISQIRDVIQRQPKESGIIYCISRAEVDRTAAALEQMGHRVLPYHAGMSDHERKANQEAFIEERAEIIVATVAFGMGIDKSNVRYVIHTGMPKSLEHYQQESGRAGRDGLEAECWMFYSAGDFVTWKKMLNHGKGAELALNAISNFCTSVQCRHKAIMEYFGQTLDTESCAACDVCLDELELVEEATVLGQKILSNVLRTGQRFGGDYNALVLIGSKEQRIVKQSHHKLSTWGILADEDRRQVRDWIEQLVSQNYLAKTGEYNTLKVTEAGQRLLRGEVTPRLMRTVGGANKQSTTEIDSWDGVDRELFETLRELRRGEAESREVPAYVIFSDASLRDMARRRPSTLEGFGQVKGVGEKKCQDFGELFLQQIREYCQQRKLDMDQQPPATSTIAKDQSQSNLPNASAIAAFPLFREGKTIAEVAEKLRRAHSTTVGYLTSFLRHEQITDPSPWVDSPTADQVRGAINEVGMERLKPIFEHLEEKVDYDSIRIVVECVRNADT